MTSQTIKYVADLSGISVRTLQYYDKIGLLSPAMRSKNGYRLYGRDELIKLQQILFYKRLAIPLKVISEIINNPRYDLLIALINISMSY
jgi:DNA-binding transcriptional MerR regulator